MHLRSMLRPLCSLWLLAVMVVEWTSADDSIFCDRPANMELCWWNNVNKRYLRFGRGDPFLRFGRSQGAGFQGLGFHKRGGDEYPENGGYLRFGRSAYPASPLMALLSTEGAHLRKRRDVSEESSDLHRAKRDVMDGGFLRFGRGSDDAADVSADKRDAGSDVVHSDREYLRFGRGSFPRFGKRYLRFGRSGPEGYLRFGKRSSEKVSS